MDFIVGLFCFIGVLCLVSFLIFLFFVGLASLNRKSSKDWSLEDAKRRDEEWEAVNKIDEEARQAELIARAIKNPDGKVTALDKMDAKLRHRR